MSDEDLYEQARERNVAFKSSVAAVQKLVSTGEWESGDYGATPLQCDGGYEFEMTRVLPMPGLPAGHDAPAHGQEIADWMKANDWSDVTVKTYSDGIDNVIVQARNEHVERIDVDIHPGEIGTGVIIRAYSICYPGDIDALRPVLNPDWPRGDYTWPELETPDAAPIFGFTEDGQPRR